MSMTKIAAVLTLLAMLLPVSAGAESLKIGYSDWPGWVAWEVAIEKQMFKKKGVEVEFFWFDYVASMDAFAAGKVDAVAMTNGDTLVTGATGAKGVMILINDYSNGNDMVVARPGIACRQSQAAGKMGYSTTEVGDLVCEALES